MSEWNACPQIGQIVKVLRGKDEENYAVIIAIVDERFVMDCGWRQTQVRSAEEEERSASSSYKLRLVKKLSNSLAETGRVTNAKVTLCDSEVC